jgi:DNA polymerase-3 subunit epsilon
VNTFIAIDFETANYSRDSAISVGLVKYEDYQPVDTYYSLIRPPRLYIRPDFTDIHGLTIDDVKDAPDFRYLWENGIQRFMGKTPLAAHNAPFDMGVLKGVFERYELPIPALRYYCTYALARRTWHDLKSYSLSALAKHFGIIYNAHNALDDAETCGKLVHMAAEKWGSKTITALLKAAGLKMRCLEP